MATDTTALKLVLTPLLIGAASLAGRRWGQAVSGWLVGLPLTSGPIAFFLALDQGAGFAAAAAAGSIMGALAEVAFCLAYAWLAARRWWIALAAGCAGFSAVAALLQWLAPPALPLVLVVFAVLVLALSLVPREAERAARSSPPAWDIPARMVVTTALVLAITGFAHVLGARLSGLLAAFPVYAGILTVFAHRLHGAAAAVQVLRGLLLGLFAFVAFFVVLGAALEPLGVALAFTAATATALAVQVGSLWFVLASPRAGAARISIG